MGNATSNLVIGHYIVDITNREEIKGHFSIMMNGEFVSEQMEVPSHADLEIIPVKQEGHFTIKMEIHEKETPIKIKIEPMFTRH